MSNKYDAEAVKASVDIAAVIGSYVDLKRDGKEFKGLCPFHKENSASFHVVPEKGFYHCFGCGEHGDVIDFVVTHTGVSFPGACKALGGNILPDSVPIKPLPKKERVDIYKTYTLNETKKQLKPGLKFDLVNPKRDGKTWKGAVPVSVHPYHLKSGALHGYVVRLEIDGQKITPMIRHTDHGWTLYPFKEPRPLYGLLQLIKNENRQCIIVEGEKCADALRRIVGDKVNVVAWAGGTNGVSRTDWSPLNDKKIVIIPDRDNPGLKAAREIISFIKPKQLKIIAPPATLPKGWDVADQDWSCDKDFFDWCQKNTVEQLPEIYDEENKPADKKPEPQKKTFRVNPGNGTNANQALQGKHSIDSRIFAETLKGKMLYDSYLKQWFEFSDIWREVPEEKIENIIIRNMDQQFPGGYQISKLVGTYNMLKKRMVAGCEDISGSRADRWVTDKNLLPMKNGVLNLKTGELLPHAPEHNMNWMLPHDWSNESSEFPTIKKFLNSLSGGDKNTSDILMCFLSAVLRGMSKCQKFLELVGTPGTGKSTFIKLACELVGQENLTTTSMEHLQNNKFETADLYGKRLAIITDADKYGGSVEVFKAATGHDPLRFERKLKQREKSFIFTGMMIVAANQPVQYKDQSTAMMRRRIPVHVDHRLDENDQDADLSDKMSAEIPGLIHYLLDMPEKYIEMMLMDVWKARESASNRSLVETNVPADWLNENCVEDAEYLAKVGVATREGNKVMNTDDWLYANYVAWAESSGRKAQLALNTFRKTIIEILQNQKFKCEAVRRSDGMFIKGIRLRSNMDIDQPTLITREPMA